jgi:hypothetical protein
MPCAPPCRGAKGGWRRGCGCNGRACARWAGRAALQLELERLLEGERGRVGELEAEVGRCHEAVVTERALREEAERGGAAALAEAEERGASRLEAERRRLQAERTRMQSEKNRVLAEEKSRWVVVGGDALWTGPWQQGGRAGGREGLACRAG